MNIQPTKKEIKDYFECTVKGIKDLQGKFSANPLMVAKTSLDRNIKMWRQDLINGLLSYSELLSDFNYEPYITKVINGIMKGIIKDYKVSKALLPNILDGADAYVGVAMLNRREYIEKHGY